MCELKTVGNQYDDSKNGSDEFKELVASRVASLVEKFGGKLFKTNAEGLNDALLENIAPEAKQHYTCNACRHFLERFGGLVAIDENGNEHSIWEMNMKEVPVFYHKFVDKALNIVSRAKVVDVFVPESKMLGYKRTGEWTHMYGQIPKALVHSSSTKTAYQVQAELKEDFKMVVNALLDFDLDTATKALTLVQSDTMYRSDKVLGVAKWFKELHEKRATVNNSKNQQNLIWLAISKAPQGYSHIRSSMIGTLLEDIQSGMSTRAVTARFAEKMNPNNYMRSTSAPSANAIVEAEKLVEKLGITESLERKYATLDDVQEKIWEDKGVKVLTTVARQDGASGVFGNVKPKDETNSNDSTLNLPTQTMTWEKFAKKILPTATGIEALVDNPNRLMALVTAKNVLAPNIMQWDNPLSWYYNGGVIDGEAKRRVEEAGGRYENNEIRATLIWENYTDLDIHCETPKGEHISFSNKHGRCGGYLDIDMNAGGRDTMKPVENIRWSSNAPEGRYKFYVHNFAERGSSYGTPFKVELEVNGQVYQYHGEPLGNKSRVVVFEFDYKRGQALKFYNNNVEGVAQSSWNVESNKFVKVNVITDSPNMWGEKPVHHSGHHVFFLLDGVKDDSEGKGRGFLNEMLKGELREIRKTLEAFTADAPITGVEESNASGVGFSKDGEWNLTLKVKTGNSEQLIKIDRWD